MDIALVSGCDTLRYCSFVGHQLYARRHGYTYHLEFAPFEGARGYWHKVSALLAHLDAHDWVVWLDDDAFITDLDSSFIADAIGQAEAQGAFLAIAGSVPDELNGAWAAYNTGVFALRCDARSAELLGAMARVDLDELQAWWDPQRLGMFTHGDQDALVWFVETQGLAEQIHWVDPDEWNSRPWRYSSSLSEHPVVHFPGHRDKTLAIADFAHRFGVGDTLVPGLFAARVWVEPLGGQRPGASRTSLAARRALRRGQDLTKRVRLKWHWIRDNGTWS